MQLVFNETFDKIVNENPSYYKTNEEIPRNIIDFIDNISSTRIIYNEFDNEYYCTECLEKLDNFYCNHCKKTYKYNKDNIQYEFDENDFKQTNSYLIKKYSYGYYFFDIVGNEVILYLIKQNINYYKYHITRKDLEISYALQIKNDGLLDLLTNEFYYYDEIYKKIKEDKNLYYGIPYSFDFDNNSENTKAYLYTDNLIDLKNTIYKYTYIWDGVNYLKTNPVDIVMITYFPIRYPQFEYLIKLKLFDLAFNVPYMFKKNNTFKEIFKVEKKYLKLMQDIDINYNELEALRICNNNDISLIKFVSEYLDIFIEIKKFINIDFIKLKQYFDKNNFSFTEILEYRDYIKFAYELRLNLKDNNVLYPKNIKEEHDKLYLQITTKNNPLLNDKIKAISNLLEVNKYEDEKYVIFPASSIESLIDESTQMSNCVRTYIEDYSNGYCQIYFMRYKDSKDKSLVTIEVRGKKVVQARTKFNKDTTLEMNNVIKKWESTLTLVDIR